MNNSNRCPKCGRVAHFYAIDMQDRKYYHCTTGLTKMFAEEEHRKPRFTEMCDTIIDQNGKMFTGRIEWFTPEHKLEVVVVKSGTPVKSR